MIKMLTLASVAAATLMTGCAMQPTHALIYSNATSPYIATSADSSNKVGESEECTNVLGLIATGDCSINSAAKNGNITTVSTVDWKGTNILGIYSTGKTIVTGK